MSAVIIHRSTLLPDPWRESRGRRERRREGGRREEKRGRERGKRREGRKGKRGEVIGNSYHAYLEWKVETDTSRC